MTLLFLDLTSLTVIISRLISMIANDIGSVCPGRVITPLCARMTCSSPFVHVHFDSFPALAGGYPVSVLFGA